MHDITAAVVRAPEELHIETLTLDDPAPGEVLVDVRATGVCHSDYKRYVGDGDVPMPIVLGHESAGVVEAVGDGVTTCSPGDSVVMTVVPSCGACEPCERGRPFLCERGLDVAFSGTMLDGTRRLSAGDEPINHFFAQSSFATKAVATERAVAPIPDPGSVEFPVAALLGCGAATGLGAVFRVADVEPGASVAVFGCGGVGMAAVMAAQAVSADPIVAVDVVKERLQSAADLGATATINASETDPVATIQDRGGVEYAFEFTGRTDVMAQTVNATEPAGHAILSGSAGAGEAVPIDARTLMMHRSVQGNIAGALRPSVDIPRYLDLYAAGRLPLDALLTHTYALEELGEAFAAMERGEGIRSAIVV